MRIAQLQDFHVVVYNIALLVLCLLLGDKLEHGLHICLYLTVRFSSKLK